MRNITAEVAEIAQAVNHAARRLYQRTGGLITAAEVTPAMVLADAIEMVKTRPMGSHERRNIWRTVPLWFLVDEKEVPMARTWWAFARAAQAIRDGSPVPLVEASIWCGLSERQTRRVVPLVDGCASAADLAAWYRQRRD